MSSLSAEGATFPDLFQDLTQKWMAVLIDPTTVGGVLREKVVLEAPDAPSLVRQWADTLLHLAQHQRILCSQVQFQSFKADPGGSIQLKADVVGELADPVRHVYRRDPGVLQIKETELRQEPDRITVRLMF